MWVVSDINLAFGDARALDLRVAPKTEIEIALDQQLGIDTSVWVVAGRATFPKRRMLKDKGPCLFPVALSTALAQSRHG